MANELTLSASLSFEKDGVTNGAVGKSVTAVRFTVTGDAYIESTVSAATSATVVPLGGVTSPGWCYFKNMDDTNFVKIRNGSLGADLVKLKPGESAWFPMYDGAVPYVIADTDACLVEYLIVQR